MRVLTNSRCRSRDGAHSVDLESKSQEMGGIHRLGCCRSATARVGLGHTKDGVFTMLYRPARSAGLLALALTGLVATATAPTQAATLYRWNDASGSPVVSDRPPPPGTPYTTLDGRRYGTSGTLQAPATSERQTESDSESRVGTSANTSITSTGGDTQVTGTVTVEKNQGLCEQAKKNVFNLETFPRIRTTDPDGTIRFMSEEEISSQLSVAREAVSSHC